MGYQIAVSKEHGGDADFWEQDYFVPFQASPSPEAKVSSGFWSIYNTAVSGTHSMQKQLFDLLGKYHASAQPIHRLLITGHSLGAALCELFTLDLALSAYRDIAYSNYNYAGPAVGNPAFRRALRLPAPGEGPSDADTAHPEHLRQGALLSTRHNTRVRLPARGRCVPDCLLQHRLGDPVRPALQPPGAELPSGTGLCLYQPGRRVSQRQPPSPQ